MNTFTKITAVTGSVAMALTMGISVAAANPDLSSLADTPCSYDQAMAAVHAENPAAASFLDCLAKADHRTKPYDHWMLANALPERVCRAIANLPVAPPAAPALPPPSSPTSPAPPPCATST